MRLISLIIGICVAMMLAGCGGTSSNAPSKRELLRLSRPKIQPPHGPPPKHLVVKELKEGSGRPARAGTEMGILYVGVDYKTGEERYHRWTLHPLTFRLGSEYLAAGLEEGLRGMRVGGRRKLIIPSRLAYWTGAVVYVVERVGVG